MPFHHPSPAPRCQVIELQRGLLPLLGMDPDYGVSRLNRLNKVPIPCYPFAYDISRITTCRLTASTR